MDPKKAIVHGGMGHLDDLLCAALAIARYGVNVERRDPSAEELQDPSILVLDVGGEHAPEMGNFDHHQLPRDAAPDCAVHMFVRAQFSEFLPGLRTMGWWEALPEVDSKGPFAYARNHGLPRYPFELASPVEKMILGWFQSVEEIKVGMSLFGLLRDLGDQLLEDASDVIAEMASVRDALEVVYLHNVETLVVDTLAPGRATGAVKDADHPDAGVLVTHDDRGNGWTLYRYNDHPAVDFSSLEAHAVVSFAHKGGFIAKTRERVPVSDVLALVASCIKA